MVRQESNGNLRVVRGFVTYALPLILAVGGVAGSWQALQGQIKRAEERHADLERVFREYCARTAELWAVGAAGFLDSRLRYAVERQIREELRTYVPRADYERDWERLYERNPSLTAPRR